FLIRLGDRAGAPDSYALAALAAREGRFIRPSGDPRSVLSTLEYGLHLEARGFADALRAHAERLGASGVRGSLAGVDVVGGLIDAGQRSRGEGIGGELFIDCPGPQGLLTGEATSTWAPPSARAIEAIRPPAAPPEPFTRLVADAHGWLETTPLQGAHGLRLVY